MKKKSGVYFVLSVVIIAILAYIGAVGLTIGDYRVKSFGEVINRGLDLQGGVSVLEEIQESTVDPAVMERTIGLLSMRVNKMGVSETSVQQEGKKRIRIEVPGMFDKDQVLKTIGATGLLKFVGPDKSVILTGKEDVKSATLGTNSDTNGPAVDLVFNASGTKKFADATAKFKGQEISIYMDDQLITSANVNSAILDGRAQISGGKMTLDEAKRS